MRDGFGALTKSSLNQALEAHLRSAAGTKLCEVRLGCASGAGMWNQADEDQHK